MSQFLFSVASHNSKAWLFSVMKEFADVFSKCEEPIPSIMPPIVQPPPESIITNTLKL